MKIVITVPVFEKMKTNIGYSKLAETMTKTAIIIRKHFYETTICKHACITLADVRLWKQKG